MSKDGYNINEPPRGRILPPIPPKAPPDVVCKGDIRLGSGCKKCSRCKSQMEEYSFTPPGPSIQDNLRNTKMQQAVQYATNIIEANKECFVAQWVMQNQDKNIEDYVLCYSYRGEAMKFWLERKE